MLNRTDGYFLTIVETGSLGRAAQKMYVSQPSLTKYIQRLESQLGMPLFDRTVSPMRLNSAGELYYQYMRNAENNYQLLLKQLNEINQSERGVLRLGIPFHSGQYFLPKTLTAFKNRYPAVEVQLYENSGDVLEQELVNQHIELAILQLPIYSNDLFYYPLSSAQVLLAAPKIQVFEQDDAPSDQVLSASLQDFQTRPFILPDQNQKLGKLVTNLFARTAIKPNVLLRTQSVATMLSLVAQGLGVGFIPESGLFTQPVNTLNKIQFYQLHELELERLQLIAARRVDFELPPYTMYFIDLLQTLANQTN